MNVELISKETAYKKYWSLKRLHFQLRGQTVSYPEIALLLSVNYF